MRNRLRVVRVGVLEIKGVGQEIETGGSVAEDVVAVGVSDGTAYRKVQIREEIQRLVLQVGHLRDLSAGDLGIAVVVAVEILHVFIGDQSQQFGCGQVSAVNLSHGDSSLKMIGVLHFQTEGAAVLAVLCA